MCTEITVFFILCKNVKKKKISNFFVFFFVKMLDQGSCFIIPS